MHGRSTHDRRFTSLAGWGTGQEGPKSWAEIEMSRKPAQVSCWSWEVSGTGKCKRNTIRDWYSKWRIPSFGSLYSRIACSAKKDHGTSLLHREESGPYSASINQKSRWHTQSTYITAQPFTDEGMTPSCAWPPGKIQWFQIQDLRHHNYKRWLFYTKSDWLTLEVRTLNTTTVLLNLSLFID